MAVKRHNVNFDITAQDSSAGVFATVEKNLKSVQKAGMDLHTRLTAGFAAVAAAVEGFQLVHAYREILGANAAMDDFAESTGSAVETLSALQRVAKVGAVEFGFVTESMGRMIKGLKGADEEGQNAAAALEFLGVKAKNADGTFRDQGEVMIDVAKKLATYADSGNKVALVQDLYGKGAQRLLPFLKDLADETDRHATLTTKQAAAAEEAEKNIRRLNLAIEDGRRELVNNYTPALNEFLERWLAASKAQGSPLSGAALVLTRPTWGNVSDRLAEVSKDIETREKAMQGKGLFRNLPFIGVNSAAAQTELMAMYRERDYLAAVQRQQARKASEDALGPLDQPNPKSALDYQTPPKLPQRMGLTSFEAEVLKMRQASIKEQVGDSEFMETSLAIKAGKFNQVDAQTGKVRELTDAEKQLLLSLAADRDMQKQLRQSREEMTKANEEAAKASDELYAKLVNEASALKDLIDPGRQYLKDKEKADELVRRGLLTEGEAVAIQRKQLEARTKVDEVAQATNFAADAAHSLGISFTSAFDRIVDGSGRSIKALDLVLAAALDVAKVIWGRTVTTPLATGIEGALKGLFGGTPTGTGMQAGVGMGGIDPWAMGGVFSRGRVTAFAGGGVVGRPTVFPMADGGVGLMGERGEEAIMPLERGSDGRLGVRARGASGTSVTVVQNFAFSANTPAAARDAVYAAAPALIEGARRAVLGELRSLGKV